jgi:transposase
MQKGMTGRRKFDYTQAEALYAEGKTFRQISDATGIGWNTVYGHFVTNAWRRGARVQEVHKHLEMPKAINYAHKLKELLRFLEERTGITDWNSPEGVEFMKEYNYWVDRNNGKVKKQPPDLTAGEFNRREC